MSDHTALSKALQENEKIVPVFIFEPDTLARLQARRTALLLETLRDLDKNLRSRGSYLIFRHGNCTQELSKLARQTKSQSIYWNIEQEPFYREQDARVISMCYEQGWKPHPCKDSMLHHPFEILKADQKPYTVFTPYFRRWNLLQKMPPVPAPKHIPTPKKIRTENIPSLRSLKLRLSIPLPAIGEKNAQKTLKTFVSKNLPHYASQRNLPFDDATSHLSIPLNFGSISIRQIFHAVQPFKKKKDAGVFITELAWRDFYRMILWHFPNVEKESFRLKFRNLPWENSKKYFQAWCKGKTGFPIVDAAMRQLNQTGWMHNRLRMITASFLVKDLLVNWQWGEAYFMEQLYDGDLAANNGGWQWCAGTGTDAQPFFRIFNPTQQAKKFDPEEKFIKKFVSERFSSNYTKPIVEHSTQRLKVVKLFQSC